jgi:hypothetical protein
VFQVTTSITTEGELTPVLDDLSESLDPFSSAVPGAILDAIRDVIDDEPLVAESFDAIRASENLDAALADDFAARDVDVPVFLEDVWSAVELDTETVVLYAEFEISAANYSGVHDLYHSVGQVTFDETDAAYNAPVVETALTWAAPAESDIDLIQIEDHQVGLGLGGPLSFLLDFILESAYASDSMSGALEAEIDCDAVVALLAPPLIDVADSTEIMAGCQNAALGAQAMLEDAVALVNAEYAQVSFDLGSCQLLDPGADDLVETLASGSFAITWQGAEPLGSMSAQFEGQLED